MKNFFLAIYFILFLTPKISFGQETSCTYDMYYYQGESMILKFECDTVEPFKIQFFSNSGDMINEIFYKPLGSEKVFLIVCNECYTDLVISILYPGNPSTFLYTKK